MKTKEGRRELAYVCLTGSFFDQNSRAATAAAALSIAVDKLLPDREWLIR